ncbi:PRMT7.2 family protein [Megaselia abdita]
MFSRSLLKFCVKPWNLVKFSRNMSESLFTQSLNPITGKNEWVAQVDDYDYHQEVARAAFADMLHDSERNQKYYAALKKEIAKLHADGKEAHVLDIGTGTGILSMMAVKSGADSVTACEAFMPMAICAEKIMKENKMWDKIKLIKKRSTDIILGEDMDKKANVLVTEVFDTELIGEGAIGIFNHAHKHLLTDDCVVIPSLSRVYAQVAETPQTASWDKPKMFASLDGDVLLQTPKEILECKGEAGVHDIQLSQLNTGQCNFISEPIQIFEFDFMSKTPILENRTNIAKFQAKTHGTPFSIFFWWDLNMDVEGEIVLSCAPYWAHPDFPELSKLASKDKPVQNVIPWRDHWMQAIYYIPKPQMVNPGDELVLTSNHDEYSFWFDVGKTELSENIKRYTCNCSFHIANCRSRIGQLNQSLRNKKYLRIFEEEITKSSVVLSLSDGSLLGLSTAKMAKEVICLEAHRFSRECLESYVKSNKLENVKIIKSLDEVENFEKITHVVAEPYFTTSIVPWDSFYFGTLLNQIKGKLNEKVTILPKTARLFAVPVEFLDLHKIRTPLGICEGFDLRIFDKFIDTASELADQVVEAQPLWEYPCKALGEVVEVLQVNFDEFEGILERSGVVDIQ